MTQENCAMQIDASHSFCRFQQEMESDPDYSYLSKIRIFHEPLPEIPLTDEETKYYYKVDGSIYEIYDHHLYIDEIINSYHIQNLPTRVPDSFLRIVYNYCSKQNNETIERWIRLSCNTCPKLCRLYGFWLEKCNAIITHDVRSRLVLFAIYSLLHEWDYESSHLRTKLLWGGVDDIDIYLSLRAQIFSTYNQNHFVRALREWLTHPQRMARLSSNYVFKMIEPACENQPIE